MVHDRCYTETLVSRNVACGALGKCTYQIQLIIAERFYESHASLHHHVEYRIITFCHSARILFESPALVILKCYGKTISPIHHCVLLFTMARPNLRAPPLSIDPETRVEQYEKFISDLALYDNRNFRLKSNLLNFWKKPLHFLPHP